LISTTSPEIGEYTSLAAWQDEDSIDVVVVMFDMCSQAAAAAAAAAAATAAAEGKRKVQQVLE
jgi:ribosomal protein L12E/L44/L45/RPP1/RPP2